MQTINFDFNVYKITYNNPKLTRCVKQIKKWESHAVNSFFDVILNSFRPEWSGFPSSPRTIGAGYACQVGAQNHPSRHPELDSGSQFILAHPLMQILIPRTIGAMPDRSPVRSGHRRGRDDIIYGIFDNLRLEFVFHTTG